MNKLDKIKIRKQLKQIEEILKEKMRGFSDADYINAIETYEENIMQKENDK